ncbi:MAG TPA: flavodoxin domain-containing protein [Syntrophorhabdales bacterium]|nr:flavodoxin domain-containing protein [Syntrophorhabdales bacterium]
MKNVMVAYYSRTGMTQTMADGIAEGVRISGHNAEVKKISDIKDEKDLNGFDAYIFGCPTYHRDMTQNFKTFLFMAQKAELNGKVGGAFGSHTHSGDAAKAIFETMEFVFKMNMTNLGSFLLKEEVVDTTQGRRACQDYGKAIGEMLGS